MIRSGSIHTSSNNNGAVKGKLDEVQQQKKSNKLAMNALSTLESKFVAGIPDVVAHEQAELARLTKMIKSSTLNVETTKTSSTTPAPTRPDNILKRIIPKYKPNSKIKGPGGGGSNVVVKEKLKIRPCLSESDHNQTTTSIRVGSCMKITNTNYVTHTTTTTTTTADKNNNNVVSQMKSGKRKVRFDKKITIHYVPVDEERGSFEWRKNLTRQGIYHAMLWKSELSELEKLELEESMSLSPTSSITF